jgi:PPP family 3-phenylpropionic acid transporter
MWDEWGAGWSFSLGSLFALAGFLIVWRWVCGDIAVDRAGAP